MDGAAEEGLAYPLLGGVDGDDPPGGKRLGALVLKVLHVELEAVSPPHPPGDDEGGPSSIWERTQGWLNQTRVMRHPQASWAFTWTSCIPFLGVLTSSLARTFTARVAFCPSSR